MGSTADIATDEVDLAGSKAVRPASPPPLPRERAYVPIPIFSEPYLIHHCAVCNTDHQPHRAHIWPKAVANEVANKAKRPGRYKDAEKRRLYMRELMRKRRGKPSQTI